MTDEPAAFDFDAALSFAGEDREYVEDVNEALKREGIRTFLDSDHLAEAWGEDLVEFFDRVYRVRSKYAILFISRHYAEKTWPRHERRSALARAIEERGAYVLPVRLDDTAVNGLRPTIGYLDTRKTGIEVLVRTLLAKLAGRPDATYAWPGDRSPRTQRELDVLLAERPAGWEWLYMAGVLFVQAEKLQPAYLDHELEYAERTGARIADDDVAEFLQSAMDEARAIMARLGSTMKPEAQERALGAPGEPGDAERIRHLASRWNSLYADMLAWSARIRGASHSSRFNRLFAITGRFLDESIRAYREWQDSITEFADGIPAALTASEPHVMTATLTVSIPETLSAEFSDELDRVVSGIESDDDDEDKDGLNTG
jgi:hypothetical protein